VAHSTVGRDSFYPTDAAGCVVTLTIEAFIDASLLGTTVMILSTASLGLGLAQSAGRSLPCLALGIDSNPLAAFDFYLKGARRNARLKSRACVGERWCGDR
jgi:hypothetical protein